MNSKPTVLLADDHQIVLDGLRSLLSPAFHLVGTARNGRECIELTLQLRPDVVVADISMPQLNGIDALAQLSAAGSSSRVVFLTMHADPGYLTRALQAGAFGYVLKHAAAEELISAIEAALRGERFLSPALCTPALEEFLDPTRRHHKLTLDLTPRQRHVLQLLAEGHSAKQIGAVLEISPRTVETHKYKMMDLLGVSTTAQLIQHALKLGLIPP